ncbi:MAG: T9SS type A sorting domain-containing protein, partial [Flavobacteriales bacterium]|nr:T9SS type A sorting domain-containing protein [Flavobacteriales bacterium]
SFGNGDYCAGDDVTGWEYYQCSGNSPFWWDSWIQNDTLFQNAVRCRLEELRTGFLHTDSINNYLDSMASYISEAQARNFTKYPIMGMYVWPNSLFYANSNSHTEVMTNMKTFLADRSIWLDNNIPGIAQYCELYEPPVDTTATNSTIVNQANNSTQLYPNPNNGTFYITSDTEIVQVEVMDVLGRVVYSISPNSHSVLIEIPEIYTTGIYTISVQHATEKECFKVLISE